MNIVLMGTPPIAKTVLEALWQSDHHVSLVVCQPDKAVGRKRVLTPPATKIFAQEKGIPVFQPRRLKEDMAPLLDPAIDLIVTIAYGQLVPDDILTSPRYGCVNLHGSLLPAYRGAAPIQRAIWDGLKTTGMTLMRMVSKMDAGAIIAQKEIVIDDKDTSSTLFNKMGKVAADLLLEQLACIKNWQEREQDETLVSFASKISKEDEHLDLSQEDATIVNQWRALADKPGGYIICAGKHIKIEALRYETQAIDVPYVVQENKKAFVFSLKHGLVYCERVKPEGKASMAGSAFMNGQGKALIGQSIE